MVNGFGRATYSSAWFVEMAPAQIKEQCLLRIPHLPVLLLQRKFSLTVWSTSYSDVTGLCSTKCTRFSTTWARPGQTLPICVLQTTHTAPFIQTPRLVFLNPKQSPPRSLLKGNRCQLPGAVWELNNYFLKRGEETLLIWVLLKGYYRFPFSSQGCDCAVVGTEGLTWPKASRWPVKAKEPLCCCSPESMWEAKRKAVTFRFRKLAAFGLSPQSCNKERIQVHILWPA